MADQPMTGTSLHLSGSQEGSPRQDALATESFTPEQLRFIQQLLTAKTNSDEANDSSHGLSWPKWDGKEQTFELFFKQLEAKVKRDHEAIGSGRRICLGIYMTIPNGQQACIEAWFHNGQANNWDWHKFLQHIYSRFRDENAIFKGGEILINMKMGASQSFASFLADYETQLGVVEGHSWPDRAKIIFLHRCLNETLLFHLVPRSLSDNNYKRYVEVVAGVAGRVEALPTYKSKNAYPTRAAYPKTSVKTSTKYRTPPRVNGKADKVASGANALAARQTPAQPAKPRAPWRSQEDIDQARERQACFRCLQTGHRSFRCPIYSPAQPPANS